MALVLLEFFLITILSLVTGLAVEGLILGKTPSETWPGWLLILVGFVCFPALLGWLSLLVPIHPRLLVGIIPLAGVLAYGFRHRLFVLGNKLWAEWRAWGFVEKGLIAGVLFVVTMVGTMQTLHYDEGFYYLPFIKWTQMFGVVPGLGNLHHRLAFNSHYLLWSALFSNPFALNLPLNDTGEYLLFLSCIILIVENRTMPYPAVRWIGGLFVAVNLAMAKHHLTSPAADIALVLICQALVWILLRLWFGANPNKLLFSAACLLLAGLVTFKLSAFVLALLILPMLWSLLPNRIGWMTTVLLVGIVSVWVVRNVILSGYPIFPISFLPPWVQDWAVPKDLILDEEHFIFLYAKVGKAVYSLSPTELKQVAWNTHWSYYTYQRSHLWIALGGVLALLLAPFLALRQQGGKRIWALGLWLALVLATGLWFFKGPDIRFNLGMFLVAFSLGILLIFSRERHSSPILITLVGPVAFVLLLRGIEQKVLSTSGLVPAPWLKASSYQAFTNTQGTKLYLPNADWEGVWRPKPNTKQCWNGPEPCTYRRFDNLVMRRPGDLSSGFRFEGPQPFLDGKPFQPR